MREFTLGHLLSVLLLACVTYSFIYNVANRTMYNQKISMRIYRWPKKVSHYQFFKKIALKIANEIRLLRKVKV